MSLYLKYRPQKVEELDLEEVRKALDRVLSSGKVSHAYLFTGPRGAGKTSSARILAKVVNCEKNKDKLGEPCGKCSACKAVVEGSAVDMVEIDAASNRGIDDIRDLKSKIGLAPSSFRKKIYIVDEVHMLTNEAFNALLKILEEPPTHSMFILCTTEAHKVPETITSRCTRITFSKANLKEMMRSLKRVVKGEGIGIKEEALEFLASEVDGSFRDGVKVLEQLANTGEVISLAVVQGVMFGATGFSPRKFLKAMADRDAGQALSEVWEAEKSGVDLMYFLKSSMLALRGALLAEYGVGENNLGFEVGGEAVELVKLMDATTKEMSGSVVPTVVLEMMVLEWCEVSGGQSNDSSTGSGSEGKERKGAVNKLKLEKRESKKARVGANGNGSALLQVDAQELRKKWRELIVSMSGNNYSLEALLSKARPRVVDGGELRVEVNHQFHKEQLEAERYRSKVEDMVSRVFSSPLRVSFEVGKSREADKLREINGHDSIAQELSSDEEDLVQVAKEIFT